MFHHPRRKQNSKRNVVSEHWPQIMRNWFQKISVSFKWLILKEARKSLFSILFLRRYEIPLSARVMFQAAIVISISASTLVYQNSRIFSPRAVYSVQISLVFNPQNPISLISATYLPINNYAHSAFCTAWDSWSHGKKEGVDTKTYNPQYNLPNCESWSVYLGSQG